MAGLAEFKLTTGDVAERCGVSRDTVVRWAEKGKIPSLRLPSGWRRFRASDVDALSRSILETHNGDAA